MQLAFVADPHAWPHDAIGPHFDLVAELGPRIDDRCGMHSAHDPPFVKPILLPSPRFLPAQLSCRRPKQHLASSNKNRAVLGK